MNSEKTKIGRAKLIKSQTLKYSTKLKTVKIKLPRTAFKAKFFLTLKANEPFTQLKKVFTKALRLYYFDSKYYICIKNDAFKYDIGKVFSQLALNQYFSE